MGNRGQRKTQENKEFYPRLLGLRKHDRKTGYYTFINKNLGEY